MLKWCILSIANSMMLSWKENNYSYQWCHNISKNVWAILTDFGVFFQTCDIPIFCYNFRIFKPNQHVFYLSGLVHVSLYPRLLFRDIGFYQVLVSKIYQERTDSFFFKMYNYLVINSNHVMMFIQTFNKKLSSKIYQ